MQIAEAELCLVTETVWTSVLGLAIQRTENRGLGPSVGSNEASVLGCVHIDGAWEGSVTLESSPDLVRKVAAILLGVSELEATPDDMRDSLGELINMIGGNIKTMLPGPSKLSVPAVVEGRNLEIRVRGIHKTLTVDFECDGQPVRVALLKNERGPV